MKLYDPHWEYLMVTIAICVFFVGFIIFFYLVPEPHMVGVVVDEYTHEKALVDSMNLKKV